MSGDSSEAERFVVVADTRRRWTRAEKEAIVGECGADKASVSAVARKHGIAVSLLFRWRRDLGAGRGMTRGQAAFVPVALALPSPAPPRAVEKISVIEIELIGGRRLRVDGSVDSDTLRRVIEVLEGR